MKYDVAVIGAGIIGLSTSMCILKRFPKCKLVVLEKEDLFSKHQTGRNSGVIHSGLYYKPNSLKAKNCIKGRELLIKFCEEENIRYELCGKIVVATSKDQLNQLSFLQKRGKLNGLKGLKSLSKEEIRDYEPYCRGEGGIFVPQTGIVNYKEVSEKIIRKINSLGGEIIYNSRVSGISQNMNNLVEIITQNTTILSKVLITCGGVYSDRLAAMTENNLKFRITPFRGEYFLLKKDAEKYVKNLIYPVPNINFPFLGVHFTKMIDGSIECGPNAVLSFAREGYEKTSFNLRDTFDSLTWPGFFLLSQKYWKEGLNEFYRSIFKAEFVKELKKLVPNISSDDLIARESGIRAQACGINGELIDDFYYFQNNNIVHICNAPSPAATASLAISEDISRLIIDKIKI